jgi:hypothetical protein
MLGDHKTIPANRGIFLSAGVSASSVEPIRVSTAISFEGVES